MYIYRIYCVYIYGIFIYINMCAPVTFTDLRLEELRRLPPAHQCVCVCESTS